jgi:PAS domain S-box-containing protein
VELKKLTQSLIEQERRVKVGIKRWESILNAIPVPIFITNVDGSIEFANAAMEKELQLSKQEIEGHPCYSLVGGFDFRHECYCSSSAEEEDFRKEDLILNDTMYIHSRTPIRNDDGKVIGYICTLNNVTTLIKEYTDTQLTDLFCRHQQ